MRVLQLMIQSDLEWFADQHVKALVASGALTVVTFAFAASEPHFS